MKRIYRLLFVVFLSARICPLDARALAHVQAPDFPPADSWIKGNHYSPDQIWLNSPPLTWDALQGKVVLIDFWEYTCINCIRTFDYLKRWNRLYGPSGLVIIGVHAPEFDFAYDPANVRRAAVRFGLTFPIVIDSEFRLWRAYGNNTWPNKFLVGPNRLIVYNHSGEGNYGEFERQIQTALKALHPGLEFKENIPLDKDDFVPSCGDMTTEVYTGSARGSVAHTRRSEDGKPYVLGAWESEPDTLRTQSSSGNTMGLTYHGAEVFAVMHHNGPQAVRVIIEQDGKPVSKAQAGVDMRWDANGHSFVDVDEPRMYYLVRNNDAQRHHLILKPEGAGLGIYSFTFGNSCLTTYAHL